MSDDYKQRLEAFAEREDVPPSTLGEVLRGGRRRLLLRRMGSSIAAVTVVAAAVWGATAIDFDRQAEQERLANIQPAQQPAPQPTVTVENPRVATFAVRAVAHAGLLNALGDVNDYEGVERVAGGWLVSFNTVVCGPSTCDPNPNGDTQLKVELDQRGKLIVSEASGPLSEDARQKLLSYEESPNPESTGLQFPFVAIADSGSSLDEGLSVYARGLWLGPIPPPATAHIECHVVVYDSNGSVIYEGEDRPQALPGSETMRSGSRHIFGVPGELSEQAERAAIECNSPGA